MYKLKRPSLLFPQVDQEAIAKMTSEEKEAYTQTFQEFYSSVYD